MAAASWRQSTSVERRLFDRPRRFEFFQAVRLLEQIAVERARTDASQARGPVGRDEFPQREVVRLKVSPSLGFPPSEVVTLERPPAPAPDPDSSAPPRDPAPPEITVSFLGLYGPAGVLPSHYTELVLARLRSKDHALADFLGIFDHRTISLFHRAWEKYRLPILYERAKSRPHDEDLVTWSISAVVGMATGGQRRRVEVDDEAFLYYSGHFGRAVRSASALEAALNEYFELPMSVAEFHGDWIRLDISERSQLGSQARPQGSYARLGYDLVVGSRVFDVAGRFRVRVGPLTYAQFREFMPTGSMLRPVSHFVRTFAGCEFDFDVQPLLLRNEAPHLLLGNEGPDPPRLGWNTWLRTHPVARVFGGVSFSLEGAQNWVLQDRRTPSPGRAAV